MALLLQRPPAAFVVKVKGEPRVIASSLQGETRRVVAGKAIQVNFLGKPCADTLPQHGCGRDDLAGSGESYLCDSPTSRAGCRAASFGYVQSETPAPREMYGTRVRCSG